MNFVKDKILGPLLVAIVIWAAGLFWQQYDPSIFIRIFHGVPMKDFEELRTKVNSLETRPLAGLPTNVIKSGDPISLGFFANIAGSKPRGVITVVPPMSFGTPTEVKLSGAAGEDEIFTIEKR